MWKRKCRRRVRLRLALLCVLGLASLLAVLFWPHLAQSVIFYYHYFDCSDQDVRVFLDNMCDSYTKGLVVGSLCAPLCTTGEIKLTKCLGNHVIKPYVFEAEWNGKPIIFKNIRPKKHHFWRIRRLNMYRPFGYDPAKFPGPPKIHQNTKLTREQFIEQANTTLFYSIAGKRYTDSTRKVLEKAVSECDLHGDGILDYDEIHHCWQLVETEEYIISSILQGTPGIIDVYGVCGSLYAVEFTPPVDSQQFLGYEAILSSRRPWKLRARLTIAILDMLESFENTPYGDVHFCDCKEPHFGIIEQNGHFVSKMTDWDSGWFGPRLSAVEFQNLVYNTTCESNCMYMACYVECNATTHTCSDKVVYNNLQVVCQKVFFKKEWSATILQDPPSNVKAQLEELLDDACTNSELAPNSPQHLLDSMRSLLLSSIS